MKKCFKIPIIAALLMTSLPTLHANSITGSLKMDGTATLNSSNLALATAATFSGVEANSSSDGDFAAAGDYGHISTGGFGAEVSVNGFSWSPTFTPVDPLWSFTDAGIDYSFDLATISVYSQSSTFLDLRGTGTIHSSAFNDTPGTWAFTISTSGNRQTANFTFASDTSATSAVPDGGMTLTLLGIAFSGFGLLRKKFAV